MTVGELIRKRRKEMGLTQEELAKMLGYSSKSSINKIELGYRQVSLYKLRMFAQVLCVELNYFLIENEAESGLTADELKLLAIYKGMENTNLKPELLNLFEGIVNMLNKANTGRIDFGTYMREVVDLQTGYRTLEKSKKLTKKAMCRLCVPFKEKYGLKDMTVLSIARRELDTAEITRIYDMEVKRDECLHKSN